MSVITSWQIDETTKSPQKQILILHADAVPTQSHFHDNPRQKRRETETTRAELRNPSVTSRTSRPAMPMQMKRSTKKFSDVVDDDGPVHQPVHQSLALQFPPTIRPHITQPITPRPAWIGELQIPQRSRGASRSFRAIRSSRKILIDIAESDR